MKTFTLHFLSPLLTGVSLAVIASASPATAFAVVPAPLPNERDRLDSQIFSAAASFEINQKQDFAFPLAA